MKNNIKTINEIVVKGNNYNSERISFLSHISHGIRTPLNAILGYSKLLVLRDLINNKQREYIQGILKGSNLLLQFVENIIDLSQLESSSYTLNIIKCDINHLIWEYTEDFYNKKFENFDTSINLMLVWESKLNDLEIDTDPILFKKGLQRLVNLVSARFSSNELEMGYKVLENNTVNVFVRPSALVNGKSMLTEKEFLNSFDGDSFDYFNYKVLTESVIMLGGKLFLNPDKHEYSFNLPIRHENINDLL